MADPLADRYGAGDPRWLDPEDVRRPEAMLQERYGLLPLPPLSPKPQAEARSYQGPMPPRFETETAANLSPILGGMGLADLAHETYNAYVAGDTKKLADYAPFIAGAVAPMPGPKRSALPSLAHEAWARGSYEPGKTWYHGSNRIDRVVEKGALNPKRATSGPMPFFTDNPEMASNYAKGKPDTSRMSEDPGDSVVPYYTIHPRDLGWQSRTPIPVERSWNFLSPEQRADIMSKWHRVGFENRDEGSGPYVLHDDPYSGLSGRDHYEWTLKNEARGNPLTALRQIWHDGGNLVGSEPELADIFKLAGFPHPISQSAAPWTEAMGVLPAYLRMRNPLVTSDVEALTKTVIPGLEQAFKRDRTRKPDYSMSDAWDKNSRFTPREWLETLKEDVASGKNGYVWTSIPDKVTDALKQLGYDGIVDRGGKGGGDTHAVAIPFYPHQVRARYGAKFDPEKMDSGKLTAGIAGAAVLPGIVLSDGAEPDATESLHKLYESKRPPKP